MISPWIQPCRCSSPLPFSSCSVFSSYTWQSRSSKRFPGKSWRRKSGAAPKSLPPAREPFPRRVGYILTRRTIPPGRPRFLSLRRQPPRQRPAPVPEAQQPLSRRLEGTAPQSPARPQTAPPRPQATAAIRPPVPVSRPARQAAPIAQPLQPSRQSAQPALGQEPPRAADDFFAKYDDPAYVQRRLQEIKRKDG